MKTEWVHKKLIDLADYYNGMAFKPSDWVESGTKIIRIEQLNNPMGNYDYYQGSYPEINAIQNEDLIFSWSATLKVAIWKWGEGVLNQHLFKVVPFENVDKYFLYYLLDYNMPKLGESSHGSTMKHIKRKELETYSVRIPTTLPAQRHIAAILSSADKVIASTQKVIAKYKQMKQGLMEDLLKPKEGWIKYEYKDVIIENRLGGNYENSTANIGYPVIKMGNIMRGYISLEKVQYLSFEKKYIADDVLKKGDLLFNTRNTLDLVGKVSIWNNELPFALYNSNLLRMKFDENIIGSNEFMNYYFNYHKTLMELRGFAIGTTSVAAIYGRDLDRLSIIVPSIKEQRRIASILSGIDAKIAAEEKVVEKYEKVKKGLMEKLLQEQ